MTGDPKYKINQWGIFWNLWPPSKKLLFGDMDSDLTYSGWAARKLKEGNQEQNRFKCMFYSWALSFLVDYHEMPQL